MPAPVFPLQLRDRMGLYITLTQQLTGSVSAPKSLSEGFRNISKSIADLEVKDLSRGPGGLRGPPAGAGARTPGPGSLSFM
jgi:hypothetical protein